MPNCIEPMNSNFQIYFCSTSLILRKGRNTINEISKRMNATKLESNETKLPLISPNENAQIRETINKYSIMVTRILELKVTKI